MLSDIQAAAERREKHKQSSDWKSPYFAEGNMHDVLFNSQKESDAEFLADYGVRAATLIPQLVAALKAAKLALEKEHDGNGFDPSVCETCRAIELADAAIAAGEGRDANRS